MLVWSFPRPEKLPLLLPFVQFPLWKNRSFHLCCGGQNRSSAPFQQSPVSLVVLRKSSLERCLPDLLAVIAAGRLVSLPLPLPLPAQVGRAIAVTPTDCPPPRFLVSRASKIIFLGHKFFKVGNEFWEKLWFDKIGGCALWLALLTLRHSG